VYAPGAIIFDTVLYPYLTSSLESLQPLTPLHLDQPYHPHHFFAERYAAASGEDMRPCINLFWQGTYLTPALLILRKEPANA
jgi:hypothetical protein